ncbi:hypothetical protein, partial [Stenotrophomonas maltophilia]|uniref:hypothetical protein n=1 Tax=Stenotrophomonas maltophilia TaxID=40324 RepID=UPI0013DC35F6
PDLHINWSAVAAGLLEPLLLSEALALDGVTATPAGALWRTRGQDGEALRLWTPADVVRAGDAHPVADAASHL